MKIKYSALNAILWSAAIFASGLLHGPLILTLILTPLACWSIVASDERVDKAVGQGQERLSP